MFVISVPLCSFSFLVILTSYFWLIYKPWDDMQGVFIYYNQKLLRSFFLVIKIKRTAILDFIMGYASYREKKQTFQMLYDSSTLTFANAWVVWLQIRGMKFISCTLLNLILNSLKFTHWNVNHDQIQIINMQISI